LGRNIYITRSKAKNNGVDITMAQYSGKGWHFQTTRHSNARKYGKAGGVYARKTFQGAWELTDLNTGKHEQYMGYTKKEAIRKFKKNYGTYTPNYIKGGLADGVNPSQLNQEALQKGIGVELEHTKNPKIARELATDNIIKNPKYYDKLEKIEKKPEPIVVKIPRSQVIKDKNRLEKELEAEIDKSNNFFDKKKLSEMLEELKEADTHNKLKRFTNEYGYALQTLGMSMPFYLTTPLIVAGVVLGMTITKEVPMETLTLMKLAIPMTGFVAGTEGVKHSFRTIKAIRNREKEIIKEKTLELKANTKIPDNEIKKIAKRVAQQEISNTPLSHELM
jgi:hypothetical protein